MRAHPSFFFGILVAFNPGGDIDPDRDDLSAQKGVGKPEHASCDIYRASGIY